MDDIVKEAREALETSHEYDRDNRREAMEDLRFTAGFQWSDAAKKEREGRPMVTINRSSQFLRQVSNPIRQNMPTIKTEPDGDDQSDIAEIVNGLLRRIQYNSSASHVYAQATEHMVACGIGWFRVVHDYVAEGFDQEILIKRVFNPLSVYSDPSALEANRSDMNWCVVSEMVPKKAFQQMYPKANPTGVDTTSNSGSDITWNHGEFVRIAEYWRRKPVKKTMALLPNGQSFEVTEKGIELIGQLKAAGQIVNTREITTYKVEMFKVSGVEQLEDPYECPSKWIPLIPVIGNEIPLDQGVYRHGLIRFQREPQQLSNYAYSVMAESFGQQPKAPIIGTAEQILPYKSVWDNSSTKPTPYLPYKHVPNVPPPQRMEPGSLNAAAVQFMQLMTDEMKATTGIYDAALGARSNETSGIAIAQRTEQGNQASFHFVDNLEHSLEHAGRVMLDMIPKIYDNERTLKLIGADDTEKEVTVNKPMFQLGGTTMKHNDLSQAKFNSVRVILGPSYASRRAEAVQQLTQLIQAMPQVGQIGADLVVKNLDFDGADQLAERLRAILPPQVMQIANPKMAQSMPQAPDPMQLEQEAAQRAMDMETQKAEMTLANKQKEAELNLQTKQQEAELNLQAKRAEKELDLEYKQREAQEGAVAEAKNKRVAEGKEDKDGNEIPDQNAELLKAIAQMMAAPKRIVRDEAGRPVGVEIAS